MPHVPRSAHLASGLGCLTTRFRRSEEASLAHPARKTRARARLRVAYAILNGEIRERFGWLVGRWWWAGEEEERAGG